MRRGPVVALLLLVCCGSLEARGRDDTGFVNVESMRRDVREMAFQDLLGEGSSPEEQQVPKKRMRNASGMLSHVEFCYSRITKGCMWIAIFKFLNC